MVIELPVINFKLRTGFPNSNNRNIIFAARETAHNRSILSTLKVRV